MDRNIGGADGGYHANGNLASNHFSWVSDRARFRRKTRDIGNHVISRLHPRLRGAPGGDRVALCPNRALIILCGLIDHIGARQRIGESQPGVGELNVQRIPELRQVMSLVIRLFNILIYLS